MNPREIQHKSIPHVIAVFIFIAIAGVYFFPQVNGYQLRQHDIMQFIGMSKEIVDFRDEYHTEPLWTNSAFSGMPAYQISTENSNPVNSLKNLVFYILPGTIGKMFFLMIGFYILMLCFDVKPWVAVIGAVAFGLASFNVLYLVAGHNAKINALSFVPPLLGSVVFAYRKNRFTGSALLSIFVCLQLSANHVQITYYMLFMLGAVVVLEFYEFVKSHQLQQFFKISSLLLLAGILGVLPTLSNLIVTYEYGKYTTRGKSELTITAESQQSDRSGHKGLAVDYIKQHDLGIGEIWSLAFPNVKGGAMGALGQNKDAMKEIKPDYRDMVSQQSSYWGEQYISGGAFYYGAGIFLLFVLGMFFIKDKMKWALFGVSVLAIILSLKYSSITDFFIRHFPLFNKFRDTKMILVLVQISFPLLGILFVNRLLKDTIDKKRFVYVSLGVSGIFVLFYLIPSVWFGFFSRGEIHQFSNLLNNYRNNVNALDQIHDLKKEIEQARIFIFRRDCLRSLFFILATATVIYLFLLRRLKENTFLILLGALVLIDLWGVDKRYLNNDGKGRHYTQWESKENYRFPFKADVADNAVLRSEMHENPTLREEINTSLARIENEKHRNSEEAQFLRDKIAFRDLNFATDYRVLSLADPFSNARTSYFHKSIGGYHGAKLKKYQELIDFYLFPEYAGIINVLKSKPSDTRNGIPVLSMLNTKYIIYNTSAQPIANPYHFGNAWFVDKIEIVPDADEEILALKNIDKHTAIVKGKYKDQIPSDLKADTTAKIELVSYKPNHLKYQSVSQYYQVAVFSEIYYPAGWNAYIDGKKAVYFEANYALRAMRIPKGKHMVEFRFEPDTYYRGRKISYAGSGLIFIFIISMIYFDRRKKK